MAYFWQVHFFRKFFGSSRFVVNFTAKAARRLRGYLIRLPREYTDGGMDSHAEEEKMVYPRENGDYCYQEY
jgi:hypothetical protein